MINRFFQYVLLSFVVFASLLIPILAPQKGKAVLLDSVIAVVNDEIITASELEEESKNYLDRILITTSADSEDEARRDAKSKILDNMISQRLISQEAKKAHIELSEDEFENAYRRNRESLHLTDAEFSNSLKKSGLTEEKYKSNLRNQLLRDKLVLFEVRSKIIITEEMIKDFYKAEYTKEVENGGFYLQQMGFTWNKGTSETQSDEVFEEAKTQTRKRAEEARQMVLDGKEFGTVAREKSEFPSAADGGDIGVLQEDDMASSMQEAITPLKPGEISPILETASGYQFFKLLSREKGGTVEMVPYESIKEELRKKLFEKKFREEFNKWVEGIKKQSYIKKMLR